MSRSVGLGDSTTTWMCPGLEVPGVDGSPGLHLAKASAAVPFEVEAWPLETPRVAASLSLPPPPSEGEVPSGREQLGRHSSGGFGENGKYSRGHRAASTEFC